MAIETAHLRLISCSPDHLLALIEGEERFEERFGLPAAKGLRAFIVSDEVSPAWLARLRASSATDPWVHGFAVVHRESRSVIGNVGFKGPPDEEGMVEIAYGIVPAFHGLTSRCRRTGLRPAADRQHVSTALSTRGPFNPEENG